jgi:glycosyltransferase involved in cell wall biosynthesis
MRVAIIHDWITVYGGGEKVVEALLDIYPDADVFTTVYHLSEDQSRFLGGRIPTTSFIQKLPFGKTKHRLWLGLMPLAVEQWDLSKYDLVISSSSAVAKGVITGPDQVHVSYVHTPIRYAWDLQHEYLREGRMDKGIKGLVARSTLHYMRMWDVRTSAGVDRMIANSDFVARRIMKTYRRKAEVIHPPVEVDRFALAPKGDFYLTASRMVPYKRFPMLAKAFAAMPDKKLVIVGDGPEMPAVRAAAGPNVEIMGFQSNAVLTDLMQRAKAFLFAAEEDFGITPVEAQAAGTPVIAYGRGGALETVRGDEHDPRPTGVFFREQTPESVVDAVKRFESRIGEFEPETCRENALRFAPSVFRDKIMAVVDEEMAAHARR